jgi:hypothetical protein
MSLRATNQGACLGGPFLDAAEADSLALTERVEAQADVLADGAAAVVDHRSRLVREVAVQELAERTLADETDAGRVFLLRIRQADLGRDPAHLGLRDLAEREQRLRELRLVQPVQEVALVLQRVEPFQQLERTADLAHARVVPGRDPLGAALDRVIEEGLELDLGVAEDVRVRRAPGPVFAQELGEHAVLVVDGEIDVLDLDAEHVGDRGGIDEVDVRRAVLGIVVVLPVLHEDADHFVALALQQVRADRGVDAAGQADHDAPELHRLDFKEPYSSASVANTVGSL